MPIHQEKPRPDYSQLQKKEQPLKTPEQEAVLESSKNIDKAIEENRKSDKAEQAHASIQNIFTTIENLQNKQVSEDNIITKERREFLDKIKQDLEDLTNPALIKDLEQELGQAGPGELIQSIAEAGYHIITEEDAKEIKEYLEQLENIKEDAAEKMGQANREIDKKGQSRELRQTADQYQSIVKQIEPNLEYQELLLQERDKIEELIQIGSITEQELNQLKQTYQQTTEQLDKMIPEEIKQRAEKDASEIQREIEAMIAASSGGYKSFLKASINGVRKLLKYHPEKSSKFKKAFVKTVELGIAATAIFLASNLTEGFGGVEEAEASQQEDFDLHKEYPNLKEHIENRELTIEEAQALLREGFEDVGADQLDIGDPENPKIAEILLKAVIKEEYGIEDINLENQPEQVQKFIQHESVDEFVEDALEDDLEETKEFIENNPEMKEWFDRAVEIFKKRFEYLEFKATQYLGVAIGDDGETPVVDPGINDFIKKTSNLNLLEDRARIWALDNIDNEQKIQIIKNVRRLQKDAERILTAMCGALDIADNADIITTAKFFVQPEFLAKIESKTLIGSIAGQTYVPPVYFKLRYIKDQQTGVSYLQYGELEQDQQKDAVITLNPYYNQTYESLNNNLIHELFHNLIEDNEAIRIKFSRISDYAQIDEPLTEILSEKTLNYLGIEHDKLIGSNMVEIIEDFQRERDKATAKAMVAYAEKVMRIMPIFEMIEPELTAIYTGAKSPEEFIKEMPKVFEAWGIKSKDAELLAQNLVNFNSIKNPITKKIVEIFLEQHQDQSGHNSDFRIAYPNPNAPGGIDRVPITKKYYDHWIIERNTGDLILEGYPMADQQAEEVRDELIQLLITEYSKQIEKILKRNLTDKQVEHIMAGADISNEVKKLVNLIDWDKE